MKLRSILTVVIAGFLLGVQLGPAFAEDLIHAGSPEAAQAVAKLTQAEHDDRMNAHSYRGGEDSAAATYYYHKAKEARALIDQLNSNQSITTTDLRHALDNSNASRYTGGY